MVVLRLPRSPLAVRRFTDAVYDLQRQWAVAVAYHSAVAVERFVAAVRGVVVPPTEVEAAAIAVRIDELHQERGYY